MAQIVHRQKPSGDITRFYGSYRLKWRSKKKVEAWPMEIYATHQTRTNV